MNDTIISVENVSKKYKLGQIGATTLRDELQRFGAKILKKDNPTSIIGAQTHGNGETFYALSDVSFSVSRGEKVGIIGRNGAGKSTLLKLISRITGPSDGKIVLNGKVASMLEVGTGFHPELTGRENIYLNGAILGMTRQEIDAKIEDIIEFSECRQFIETPVKRYSSGMYVKLAFSVAVHLDSDILIMDEVLAVGDTAFQKKCLQKMNSVSSSENRTILYVSHNMSTVRALCDRCIVLDQGKVLYDGDVENAIRLYYGENLSDLPSVYDNLNEMQRPSSHHGVNIRFEKFAFTDKEIAVFSENQQLRFSLWFRSVKDIDNVKLYLIIKTDTGTTVGMAQTYEGFADLCAGMRYKYEFESDISALSPGKYSITLAIYSDFGDRKCCSYDRLNECIFFAVKESIAEGLTWHESIYGNIRLPELKVISAGISEERYEE